ncbi:uncharacterized protein [Drosophila kikkawai]|uniref:Uncharacterized protein isoform X1 n=1 Tax=Drosophila kikkawai TaxID=30033 RepID=A0A6P4ITW5_DROKI|nr:cyclic AMP-responsive element-binding protein 5 isoform X1 [Drosophila kikkawai]
MRMVRPIRRKGIEEVYGSKMDTLRPVKSVMVTHAAGMNKTTARTAAGGGATGGGGGAPGGGIISSRQTEQRPQRSFVTENDYYITTNLPMTANNLRNANATASQIMPSPYNAMSSRRNNLVVKASARQPQMTKVPHFAPPESKVNNSIYTMAKPKESHRHGKCHTQRSNYALNDCVDFSDKELMGNQAQSHNHHHQHNHGHQMQLTQNMVVQHPTQHQLHQQQMSHNSHNKQQQRHLPYLQQQQQHPHPHQKHSRGRGQPNPTSRAHVSIADDDDEKEDDPEEFFELIRQTVQKAVGNTISDALLKNFRDLGQKVDRFSGELKQTNEQLEKLQEMVTSKVIYYGEENSRHFRYLCMKSEYDKMFYQHQSMMAGNPTPEMVSASKANLTEAASQASKLGCKPSQTLKHSGIKVSKNQSKIFTRRDLSDMVKPQTSYHNKPKQQQKGMAEPRKTCSDQSLTAKSSEMGMREVLGQIQRFCNQIQMNDGNKTLPNLGDILVPKKQSNDGLCEPGGLIASRNMAGCQGDKKDEDTELDTPLDSMDEYAGMDEFQFSSEVSSCSDDDMYNQKYTTGDVTTRGPALGMRNAANKGAGDGQ